MKPSYYPSNPTAPWRVSVPMKWSPTGKRRARYLKSQEEAKKFCQLVRKRGVHHLEYLKDEDGNPVDKPAGSAPVMTKHQEELWTSAVRHLATELGSINELYEAVARFKATRVDKLATVEEAFASFYKERENDPNVTSDATLAKYKNELRKLIRQFPGEQLSTIEIAKIQELRRAVKGSRTTYSVVKTFFGWAKTNGYVKENPMKDEKPWSDWGVNNDYYKVEPFGRMLRMCAGLDEVPGVGLTNKYQDLLPWLILGGFGGLRTSEISRRKKTSDALKWTDLGAKMIEIRAAITKTRKRRVLSKAYAIDAIQAWLKFVPSGSEFVCRLGQHELNTLKKEFKEVSGLDFEDNGLRNSFGTYAIHYDSKEGAGSVALQMGNSEKVLLSNYVGDMFAEGTGQAWFNLRPDTAFTSEPAQTQEGIAA